MAEKKKQPEQFHEDLSRLLAMLEEKLIQPVIAQRLPLREAARAHELLERASVSGKIVLMCQE
jgi:NADPH:quinone reductase-like Zn-dependent oxidoreductase